MTLIQLIKQYKKSCLIVSLLLLLIVGWKSSLIAQQNALVHQDFAVVNWSNQAGPPALLFKAGSKQWIEEFNIDLRFLNKDTSFQYGNLFQTSSGMDGIRIEMHPPGRLVLITGSGNIVTIADQFTANEFHKLQLRFKRGVSFEVGIDGKPPVVITDPNMIEAKLRMSNFTLGSGYGLARTLYGEIDGFKSDVLLKGYSKLALFAYYLFFICMFGVGMIATILLSPQSAALPSNLSSKPPGSVFHRILNALFDENDFFSTLLGSTLILIGAGVGLLQFASPQFFGMAKWLPFLCAPVFVVAFSLQFFFTQKLGINAKWFKALTRIITACYVFGLLAAYIFGESRQDLIIFFLIFSAVLFSIFERGGLNAVYGAIVGWVCLSSLLNWQVILGAIERNSFTALLIGMAVLIGLKKFIDALSENSESSSERWSTFLLASIAGIVIVLLSIRSDSLFIYGAAYHWEYFVGPIRGLRDGGHLLYDIPSQYGFLNILLASKIPVFSSWQAFYIFQSVLLALSASFIIAGLWSGVKSSYAKLAMTLVVLLAIFYADPEWIGPQPFPSSSAVRFIWCYLILSACLLWAKNRYFNWILAGLWSAGVIWSAESSFYCTTIFGFIVGGLAVANSSKEKSLRLLAHYLWPALALLGFSISLIIGIYKLQFGIDPDFKLYFEYVLGYASGHGYVPFDLTGPGNFLFFLFIVLGFIHITFLKKNLIAPNWIIPISGATGCAWIISSYYLGRPVPQNVTAMMPLFITCGLIGIKIASQAQLKKELAVIAAAMSAIIFVGISPLFMQTWWGQMGAYSGYDDQIIGRLPKASSELISAIEKINSEATIPMVFFGNAAALPKLPEKYDVISEKTWAPVPLQLIQIPINSERRDEIIERFMGRVSYPQIIFIHENGVGDETFSKLIELILKIYPNSDFIKLNEFEIYSLKK